MFYQLMRLPVFIEYLFAEGKVAVESQIDQITEEELQSTKIILQRFYKDDILERPLSAPGFLEDAALWAATYFYYAVHLTVIRDAGEEMIEEKLKPYQGNIDASAIYSADLVLRSLPQLFELAKGLAPADILVQKLRQTASQWPFSSVGLEIEEELADHSVILSHESLKIEYIDRIIQQKDQKRVSQFGLEKYIYENAGDHLNTFWPGFKKEQTTTL